jgi:uncharacterized protein with HEPN domain
MQPEDRDAAFLWDMLRFSRDLEQVIAGVNREAYLQDRVRQLAVERAVEVLGEAARQVSETFQHAHPEIPWRPIIAQRHVLAHDYGRIDHERLWKVATVHVPELIARLSPLVPPLPDNETGACP